MAGGHQQGVEKGLASWATALVTVAAALLWHFVEKPFVRRSSHYVATNRG